MALNFQQVFQNLENLGLTDVMLPFLLIFIVLFAVLQKTRILGEHRKNLNVAFAIIVALMVVIPHVTQSYPPGADVVEMLNKALPQVSLVAIAGIMLLLLIGLFGGDAKWVGGSLSAWIGILSFVIIVYIFGAAAGWWTGWDWVQNYLGSDLIAAVIIILVFGVLIAFITGAGENAEHVGAMHRMRDDWDKLWSGGRGGGGHGGH
ncbi:hypothetical protein HZB01_04415 [Candidatus Woesearchaeota archaeon]|nr:hypothetical protein [Candidatus Woesearchaeota archaeon]